MLKIGLTGGIGSGKSTIAKIIETLGYPVYISDSKASELINRDEEIKKHLTELLGKDIYQSDGNLDKKRLATIIFNDKEVIKQSKWHCSSCRNTGFHNMVFGTTTPVSVLRIGHPVRSKTRKPF